MLTSRTQALLVAAISGGLVAAWQPPSHAAPPPGPELSVPASSPSGGVLARFETGDATPSVSEASSPRYELSIAEPGSAPEVCYRGPGPSAYISGLEAGHYELRLRERRGEAWSGWSPPASLEVEPPSARGVDLARARRPHLLGHLGLLAAGASPPRFPRLAHSRALS